MTYNALPNAVLDKAIINPSGERGWRLSDVEAAIQAGRRARLACLGGSPQFQLEEGICEPYWISLEPHSRLAGETWEAYVDRTADEVLAAFGKFKTEADFDTLLRKWPDIHSKLAQSGLRAEDHLVVLLDWESES